MKSLLVVATLLAALLAGPSLFAATFVMGYTPAGGVTVGNSGFPFLPLPALFTYSGFNGSAYQTLYYGVNFVANVAQTGSPTGNMAFNTVLPNGTLVWTSTVNWVFNSGTCGTVSTPTQFLVQIQPLTGTAGFLSSGAFNGATTTKGALGIVTGSSDPLFQIVSAGNFQTTFQFLTWDGNLADLGNGTDLQDYFANCNGGSAGLFQTSVDFEFWWNIKKTTAKTLVVGFCKTNASPYTDINSAIAAAPAGATILICPNTYSQQLTITQPLTLQGIAYGANQAVILQPPPLMEQTGTTPVTGFPVYAQILVQDAGPVNISGLTIDGGGNFSCPQGALAGVVFLSASTPSSGKFFNSVVRNTAGQCSQGAAIYSENGSGSASNITIQGNSIHNINGGAIMLGPNMGGTISTNTIEQASSGISFQHAGTVISATGNTIVSVQDGISLNSATGVVATGNRIINSSDKGVNWQDNSGGGNNKVTGNTIIEAACGISTSGAASSDTILPNTVQNSPLQTCQ